MTYIIDLTGLTYVIHLTGLTPFIHLTAWSNTCTGIIDTVYAKAYLRYIVLWQVDDNLQIAR